MIEIEGKISTDDLHGMIRHVNRLLVLIGDHEIGVVVTRVFSVLWADYQEALVHEVWVSGTDIRYLLNSDDVVHVQGKKVDKCKIQLFQVKHVEDVIESKEEIFRGECVDVQPLMRHVNHVERVSWILRGDQAFLSSQHIVMKSPEIAVYGLYRFLIR